MDLRKVLHQIVAQDMYFPRLREVFTWHMQAAVAPNTS